MRDPLLFLSWGNPWPPHSGAAIRRWRLLSVLGRAYPVDLLILSRHPLSKDQRAKLGVLVRSVVRLPLRDVTAADRGRALVRMIVHGLPYHSAVLLASLKAHPDARRRIQDYPGIIFACAGHWGTLIRGRRAPHWILSQNDADVDFWRVYASQAGNPLARAAARVNRWLSAPLYKRIYQNAGLILSICEEDKQLTLGVAPDARVDVLGLSVDCSYFTPTPPPPGPRPPVILFTGTSAARNVTALRWFTGRVWPLVRKRFPEAELMAAGDFIPTAREAFKSVRNIQFTGRVDDIRPCYSQSQIYISPFEETHGMKVKVAEAMAMGMAIVSTPAGIRGYPLLDGESVLLAVTPEAFASSCIRLLTDAPLRERLGGAARRVAELALDVKVAGARLQAIVDGRRVLLAGRGSGMMSVEPTR